MKFSEEKVIRHSESGSGRYYFQDERGLTSNFRYAYAMFPALHGSARVRSLFREEENLRLEYIF